MANRLIKLTIIFLLFYFLMDSMLFFNQDQRNIDILKQVKRIGNDFFPPDFSQAQQIRISLIETIRMATLATFFATLISLIVALISSYRTSPVWLRPVGYLIVMLSRTIPSLILAVLSVALLGVNGFAGVLALSIYSIGYLSKFFTDILDQAQQSPYLWLKMEGTPFLTRFAFGLWPSLKSAFISKIFWMWEYNIRSAAIIGYVGAGGIGLLLHSYQEFGQWKKFSAVLIIIFMLILLLEGINYSIKKMNKSQRYDL